MGPLLALFGPCFRKNVIVTSKIVSFSCSLDHFLLKNVIVFFFVFVFCFFFFENKFRNGAHLKKKSIMFHLLFTFSSHQEKKKTQKITSAHISLT